MTGVARLIFGAILAVTVLHFAAPYASAASKLDQYRARGIIVERYDGLLEVRSRQAPADAQRLVREVNAKRSEIYRKRARSEGVPVQEVAKVYASEILGKAPAGTYFKRPDGSYLRK